MGNLQNTQLMLQFLKHPFLVQHFSYYTLMTLLVISVIYPSILIILLSKFNQASDLWQQLEMASELESDLRDTLDQGSKQLVDFNTGKTFDRSKNTGAIDVKRDGSVLEEKSSFKMLGLPFPSKLDWGSYITLLKLPSVTIPRCYKDVYGNSLYSHSQTLEFSAYIMLSFDL